MPVPPPFSDDFELVESALRSLASPRLARALIDVLHAVRDNDDEEEHEDGSRQATAHHRHPAAFGTGPQEDTAAGEGASLDAGPGAGAGPGLSDVIPDSITPVVGWRAWKLVDDVDDVYDGPISPQLRSLHFNQRWTPGRPLVAKCDDGVPKRRHVPPSCRCPVETAPATNCRCGIYAAREFRHVAKYVDGAPKLGRGEILVIGRIALWGRVMEYEDGWRAETGYPQSFFIPATLREHTDLLQHLVSFDVPVLDDTELKALGWTPSIDQRRRSEAPIPDAPGLPADVASRPLDSELGRSLAGGLGRSHATRFLNAARRRGAGRLGQLLALSYDELWRERGVGGSTLERFRAWRIEQGFGDYPTKDARPLAVEPSEDQPTGDPAEGPDRDARGGPTVANNCCGCGTVVMAYGGGRVLCEACRPISAQVSALRSAAKRAVAAGGDRAPYDETIAKLEAQRPRGPTTGSLPSNGTCDGP